MKKQFALLSLALLLFSVPSFADLDADLGDIVIFDGPHISEHLKAQLFVCNTTATTTCDPKQLTAFTNPTPNLASADHYIYRLAKLSNQLVNKPIYVKLYSFERQQWSRPFVLIKSYRPDKNPFYQFICFYRKENIPPHCIGGQQEKQESETETD